MGAVGATGGGLITAGADTADVHNSSLVTVKVYVPAARFVTVVVPVVPLVVILSGKRVRVHVPPDGRPFRTTLPVNTVQLRLTIVPIDGAEGMAFTVSVYVATAAEQGVPNGLSVVAVIVTVLPLSPAAGVYVNENGDVVIEV
jgi:hypothetical protein